MCYAAVAWKHAGRIRKLLDKHVVGVEVKDPRGVYEVGKMGQQKPEQWSEEKTRNETDIIKTRISKMIEQDLRDDPYAQEAFSKLLRQAIEEAAKLFDHPLKQYERAHCHERASCPRSVELAEFSLCQ